MTKLYDDITENFDLTRPRVGGTWYGPDGQSVQDRDNPGLMDTEASRFTLASLMSFLAARLLQPMPMTQAHFTYFSRFLRRQARRLWETEMFNAKKLLRRDLQMDPAWRARVLADLGGWKAMQAWRARDDKRYDPPAPAKPAPRKAPGQPRARTASRVKTDRDGLFRLPVISKYFKAERQAATRLNYNGVCAPWSPTIKPIEIHPNDLEYAPNLKKLWKKSPKAECPLPPLEWCEAITLEYNYWMDEIAELLEELRLRFCEDWARVKAPP